MMDEDERYNAALWYVAGYMAAARQYENLADKYRITELVDPRYPARKVPEALENHVEGQCLACGREGVAILDGVFCERCSPGVAEILDIDG